MRMGSVRDGSSSLGLQVVGSASEARASKAAPVCHLIHYCNLECQS